MPFPEYLHNKTCKSRTLCEATPDFHNEGMNDFLFRYRIVCLFVLYKFEYQCPGSPSTTEVGNIFDIYSLSNSKSLLSVYLMMNSNQIGIDYNGVTVMKYGPPASFSFNSFVKFTITVTESNVILDNGVYDQWVPITSTVSSPHNVIYFSSKVYDALHVSAMGTIRNIRFEGLAYHFYLMFLGLFPMRFGYVALFQ